MKKRYQTDREQAVRQFHRQAEESEQELQLHLPLKEVAAALQQGVGELMELNPSAARSLEEGMEETLTVHRLGLDDLLRRTLATTNPIESAFSVVDRVCGRVKRWRGGDQRERWVGAGLWLAEKSFRRVKGYKHLPKLLDQLARLSTPPPAQAQAA